MPHAVAIAPSADTPITPVGPRLRFGKVCVAIQGGSPAELMDRAEAALKDSKFLEFRLDSLPKPAAALMYLKQFLAEHREVTAIGTCRRKAHGGGFDAPLATELEILTKAAQAGCQIIDLEVESAEECKPAQLARLRTSGAALMISFHDFTRTKGLEQAAGRIEAFKPDLVKIVSTARTLADNLAVLRLIEDRSLNSHVIGIAMGEEGIVSRVLVSAGRCSLYLRIFLRWNRDCPWPDDDRDYARSVSTRASRPGHTHLRSRRKSRRSFPLSAAS